MFKKMVLVAWAALATLCVLTLARPVWAQDNTPSVVHHSTWGALKALYHNDATSSQMTTDSTTSGRMVKPGTQPMSVSDQRTGPFPGGDWSSRVLWEARHALSQSASGTSAWSISVDKYGPRWLGDWNYATGGSDNYAFEKASSEAAGYIGPCTDDAANHHRAGWCPFFVRLILYRSTYWAGYGWHLTMPNYPNSVYSWCNGNYMTPNPNAALPGWIGLSPSKPHAMVLDSRDTVRGSSGYQTGWWVIDSNWVGSDNGYVYYIGKHFLPDSALQSMGFWFWCPTLATPN